MLNTKNHILHNVHHLFSIRFLQIWYQNKREMCLFVLMYFNWHKIKQCLKYLDFFDEFTYSACTLVKYLKISSSIVVKESLSDSFLKKETMKWANLPQKYSLIIIVYLPYFYIVFSVHNLTLTE